MRKEWILSDEEKYLKRVKIVRNRLLKQQVHQRMMIRIPIHKMIHLNSNNLSLIHFN